MRPSRSHDIEAHGPLDDFPAVDRRVLVRLEPHRENGWPRLTVLDSVTPADAAVDAALADGGPTLAADALFTHAATLQPEHVAYRVDGDRAWVHVELDGVVYTSAAFPRGAE